ncbi:type II toxin-antitoxin system PemK/MazF family toxin [Microbacterium koreense]|uniref:Type II toxin-antitoxin system PemK/MazF family toxin n=1 Tax=Microbacterium koreense TaxID=323761 RepID=A0ABW2ZSW0_9MICO
MSSRSGFTGLVSRLMRASARALVPKSRRAAPARGGSEPGQQRGTETHEVAPPARGALRITYAPDRDGDPDAGEIVWTWVPYAENDGRGKDRPVLVIARQSAERVYVVRLTSKDRDGDRDFLPIGSGEWDSQRRPSWVDIEQIYSVHASGMRREAAALDLDRFVRVAAALQKRYGWDVGNR